MMYSVLLVEDEKIELDTLKNYVAWEACGITKVYTARGAKSALQCIAENEPDILITDIQMPGMSGIELAEIVRQEGYECKIVFLTGYDRFEYAKEAIRLQADEFLLKPFQIEEVETLTEKLIKRIKNEQIVKKMNQLAAGKILEKLCCEKINEEEYISEVSHMANFYFGKPVDEVLLSICALTGLEQSMIKQLYDFTEVIHVVEENDFCYVLLHEKIDSEIFLCQLQKKWKDGEFQGIYCKQKAGLNQLSEFCKKIVDCMDVLFYEKSGMLMECKTYPNKRIYEDMIEKMQEKSDLFHMIVSGEEEKSKLYLQKCLEYLKGMQKNAACQNAYELFLYLHRRLEKLDNLDGAAAVPNLFHSQTYEKLCANFQNYIQQCCEIANDRKHFRWKIFVQEYVSQNYMNDCTVEEMAEKIQLSPNYIRRRFKEETGLTILEYLTDYRLEMAAKFLREKRMKVKEVGVAVGYPNVSYFTQLFSRKYGVTPNEYKKTV